MTHKEIAESLFQLQLKAGQMFGDGSDKPVTHAEAKELIEAMTQTLGSFLRYIK